MAPKFKNGIHAYKVVESEATAHGGKGVELIVLLYDGISESLAAARGHIERKEYKKAGEYFSRAMTIISGLRETLDFESGSPVAQDLLKFYNALTRQIIHSQTTKDLELLDKCIEWTTSVREAWSELVRQGDSVYQTRGGEDTNRLAAARSGAAVAAAC
jgi:flagellar protein FliS